MNESGQLPAAATVLLVEDHVDSRLMYAEFLRSNFTVVEAPDGVVALEVMRTTRPDVVVTDLRDVPVIALSGYSGSEHQDRARRAGSNLVLQKPCLPDELARAVASATSSRKDT
jgi:CheY-like chemotaxis protein